MDASLTFQNTSNFFFSLLLNCCLRLVRENDNLTPKQPQCCTRQVVYTSQTSHWVAEIIQTKMLEKHEKLGIQDFLTNLREDVTIQVANTFTKNEIKHSNVTGKFAVS